MRQAGQSGVAAPTLGGELRAEGEHAAVRLIGGSVLAGAHRWSAQADLNASWLVASRGPLAWEIGAAGSALRYSGAPSGTSGNLIGRQHVRLGDGGIWVGGGGGLLARPGWSTPVGVAEAGGWGQRGRARGSLTLTAQRARLDTPITLVADTNRPRTLAAAPPRVTPSLMAFDATASGEWRGGAVELSALAAVRRAARQHAGLLPSVYGLAAWWIAPRSALTASAGTLAADPLRALPGRHVATLGIRLRPAGPPARTTPSGTRASATPAVVVGTRDGRSMLRVRAPGATSVELRGDVTSWRPMSLTRVGDWWELAAPLSSGTQRLAVRIDAGAWHPPANLPQIADDFGELVGLLVVP